MAVMDNIDGWNEDCAGVSRTRHRRRDPLVAFRTPFASARMEVLGFRVLLSLLEEFFFCHSAAHVAKVVMAMEGERTEGWMTTKSCSKNGSSKKGTGG